jgi:predicted nucleic acid-binding protein
MPATAITYSNAISKAVSISEIYLESSFIFDLIQGKFNPSLLSKPQIRDTKRFYDFLSVKQVDMWTSYLSAEEIMFKFFRLAMQKEIGNFETRNSLTVHLSYADFKRNHYSDFMASYNRIRSIFTAVFLAIDNLKIKIRIPREFEHRRRMGVPSKGRRIAQYATSLLNTYMLEPADAFHISTARCSGTKCIATNDFGFKDVNNIMLFSFA